MKILVIDTLENHTRIFERKKLCSSFWCLKLIKAKVLIMMMMMISKCILKLGSERTISFCFSEDLAVPHYNHEKNA